MGNFNALIRLGRRSMSAACLLLILAATTNAYSLVMRGGKLIEIPAQFSVTNTTLTYEAAPGVWITLLTAAIDIPATERANNEAPGSLLGRISKAESSLTLQRTSPRRESKAARSVTNRDLESFQRSRLESELAYDKKLKEQGLPSLAELRAKAVEEAERFSQEIVRRRAEAEADERTALLQAQIAALNAELNYLQSSSGDVTTYSSGAFPAFGGVPFFGGRSRVNRALFRVPFGFQIGGAFGSRNLPLGASFRFPGFRRNIIVAPGTRFGGRRGFGGRSQGRRR